MTNNRLNLGRLGKFAKTTGSALIQRVAGNSSSRLPALVFRVTELPLDLKLYLANFFDPGEARKVLLANREFHEIFARAVWHSIWTGLVLRRKGGISLEALKRYGHLVHILQIGNITHLPAEFYTCVPNVMWVRIVYCEHPDIIFDANQFSALANVRRVEVRMDITKQLWFDNTSAWIYDTSRSGHVNEIILEQDSSRDSDNVSMAQMYQIATNGAARRGLRFALKVRDSTPPQSSEWAELAPRITHLTVSPPHATCFGSFYDMLLKDTSLYILS
ncbi:hypothetical protein GQ42DRAFT_159002 [Ramicandelaber brevisporus]|nr:hypothetical protein GQ42DRAFT_159002 [Ramicandelaber brevisporus]